MSGTARPIASTDIEPFFVNPSATIRNTVAPLARVFDVRRYAPKAIGAAATDAPINIIDGATHPLSAAYTTLAAAQNDFPKATALSQEIGFHCVQKAVDQCNAAGGGYVYVPAGQIYMGSSTLLFPSAQTVGITLGGDNFKASILNWQTDVGSHGICAITKTTRKGSTKVDFEKIKLQGPGTGNPGWGNQNCYLRGIGCASNWRARQVHIVNFFAGLDIWDDHQAFIECEIIGCFLGVFFSEDFVASNSPGNTMDYGDQVFINTNIGQCLMACLAVAPSNQCEHAYFNDCHLGYSPYAIYRPAIGAYMSSEPTAVRPLMSNTSFWPKTQAEACGNGLCKSAIAVGSNGQDRVDKCTFRDIQFYHSDTYKISAADRCVWQLSGFVNSVYVGPHCVIASGGLSSLMPANRGYFDVATFQSNSIMHGYFDLCSMSPMVTAGATILFNYVAGGEQFDGEVRAINGTCAYGSVVCEDGFSAKPNVAGGGILGVTKAACAVSGQGICVVTKRITDVRKTTLFSVTQGDDLTPDETDPTAVRSTRYGGINGGIVGRAYTSATAGATTVGIFVDPIRWTTLANLVNPPDNAISATAITLDANSHMGKYNRTTSASTVTVTIPTQATAIFPADVRVDFEQYGAGQLVFAPASGVTIQNAVGLKALNQFTGLQIRRIPGSDTWVLSGATKA